MVKKIKKFNFGYKIISFIFLFFVSLNTAFALDYFLEIDTNNIVQPTNNTVMVDSSTNISFSVSFNTPKINGVITEPNLNYNVYFEPSCDGKKSSAGGKYIYNRSKTSVQSTKITLSWQSSTGFCPIGTKTFGWKLLEINQLGEILKTYHESSFALKEDTRYRGYYYITKDLSSNGSYYFFSTSKKFEDVDSCLADSSNYKGINDKGEIYKTCQMYDSLPALNTKEYANIPVDVNAQKETNLTPSGEYSLLAPLGDSLKTINTNNIADYFNIMIEILIGLCAALAVIMIVISGIEYMGTDSIFTKGEAKKRMGMAVLGLLIALGSYAILNTINPDLLKTKLNIGKVAFVVDYDIPQGTALTYNGEAIKINFNTEAYPAAKKASSLTGVEPAFILAIFGQETSSGGNTGRCNYTNANMGSGQLEALKIVAGRLQMNWQTINMSCSGATSGDHGGAIGLTQFIPTTWLQYAPEAKRILGHEPNPWVLEDAITMTAVFLKDKGGVGSDQNIYNAACKYFGSCVDKYGNKKLVSCSKNIKDTYGNCILGKVKSLREQIASLEKGELVE